MEKKKELGNRVRNYIFTLNNPPKELDKKMLMNYIVSKYKCNYVIIAHEYGHQNGTEHLQGFISLKNNTYFMNLKKYLENCVGKGLWLHEAYGNENDNEQYLKKDGDYLEYGNRQMTSSQLQQDLIDDILNGKHLIDLMKKYSHYVMHHYRDFKAIYNDIKCTQQEYEQLKENELRNKTLEEEWGVIIKYDK